jgi:crotonobetainyl-CoA:carnitine CoA-transferase CaiB-like acyl-CoA transferase
MQWCYEGEPDGFSDAVTVYPDHVAGRIVAIGVLALLIRRLRIGRGGAVSVSQAELMLSHLAPRIAADALARDGHAVAPDPAASAVYPCAGDDEWCVVTIRDDRDKQAVAAMTGGAPLADWLRHRSPGDAMAALQAGGVSAGAMLRVAELPAFDYYVKRRFFRDAAHPHIADSFKVEAAPVRSERLPDPPERPAPLMGEHSAEILRAELGLSEAELARLVEAKIAA